MKIGATSFAFRYLLIDQDLAPPLQTIVDRARQLGLERLQICENARPLEVPTAEWEALLDRAKEIGIEIQLGCKTLDAALLERYMQRASGIPSRTLRVVLEDPDVSLTQANVNGFLKAGVRLADKYGMRLALENHFDLSVRQLAAAADPFPPDRVGFCVDAANSLRRFETAELVFECLGSRAYCYHLKDFRILGSNVGFTVAGAPLGKGELDLDWILDEIGKSRDAPEVYLENWVPPTGVWEQDVEKDWEWLSESLGTLRERLGARLDPAKIDDSLLPRK